MTLSSVQITKARNLRRNMTEVEKKLWAQLRDRRLDGYKFRRQVPMGVYIADFLCESGKLIVELDGSQHSDNVRQTQPDAFRAKYLESLGYKVIRFFNNDVNEKLDSVLEKILEKLSHLTAPLVAGISPHRREF